MKIPGFRDCHIQGMKRQALTGIKNDQLRSALAKLRRGQELDFDERQLLFESCYSKYHDALLGYVRDNCPREPQDAGAEDMVQEAFVFAMERLARQEWSMNMSPLACLLVFARQAIRKYTEIRVIIDFVGPREEKFALDAAGLPPGWGLRNFNEI